MKCKCGKEVLRVRIIYKDGFKFEGCSNCLGISVTPAYDFRNTDTMILSDGRLNSIGVGHLKDIERRWIDKDSGEVFLKTNKTYFCSTSTGRK